MEVAELDRASEAALAYFTSMLKKEATLLGVEKQEDGWKVELESVDYRGAGFDPTLGLYEVMFDKDLNLTSYRRTHLRRASQLTWIPSSSQ